MYNIYVHKYIYIINIMFYHSMLTKFKFYLTWFSQKVLSFPFVEAPPSKKKKKGSLRTLEEKTQNGSSKKFFKEKKNVF